MGHVWRRWHRHWHGACVAALRSTRSPMDDVVHRTQPVLSRVYKWLVDRKRTRDARRPQRLGSPHVPVLSVGNVTFGGTGKTPCVQFLLAYVLKKQHAADDTHVPLLLTRGYGDDEWRMLLHQFPAAKVAVGSDRVAAGAAKVKELDREGVALRCVVVDDGFQQWRLARDLDIVMVDALHPLGNGRLLPWGSLRELPREAFARADVVIVHHANLLEDEKVKWLMEQIRVLLNPRRRPILATSCMKAIHFARTADMLAGAARTRRSVETDPSCFKGRTVLVVCGVGNPESVALVVKQVTPGARVELEAFPDHHMFSRGDVRDVVDRARELQGNERLLVVTTEKDFARSPRAMEMLASEVDLRVLRCELELLHNREQVMQRIDATLGPDSVCSDHVDGTDTK
ncbi:hypothetical protein PsorP6_010808 [Peronosclerospora sorghi]|uniref:Uncharacterized protein n=1 Tax=Peronosclerospora sorghi TaxID=230839 RepID=A0ACC0VW33_9STRA|nr:hypothetical protein PsorP6_010808 [Peronosclerospora sorghi]